MLVLADPKKTLKEWPAHARLGDEVVNLEKNRPSQAILVARVLSFIALLCINILAMTSTLNWTPYFLSNLSLVVLDGLLRVVQYPDKVVDKEGVVICRLRKLKWAAIAVELIVPVMLGAIGFTNPDPYLLTIGAPLAQVLTAIFLRILNEKIIREHFMNEHLIPYVNYKIRRDWELANGR